MRETLSHREEAYARARVLQCLPGPEAYESAGFKPHRANWRRLESKEPVKARMAELAAPLVEISAARLRQQIDRLECIVEVNLGDMLKRDEAGALVLNEQQRPEIDWNKITRRQWAAVAEYDQSKGRIKFYNKPTSIAELIKYDAPDLRPPINPKPSDEPKPDGASAFDADDDWMELTDQRPPKLAS